MSAPRHEVNMTNDRLNLRFVALLAGLACSALAAAAPLQDSPRPDGVSGIGTRTAPLRPLAECLDPQQARGWSVINNDEIVVDAGRRKYHITLASHCPDLNWTQLLRFRTGGGTDRICGYAMEAVLPDTKGGILIPCSIGSISVIDKDRYRALTTDASAQRKARKAAKHDAAAPAP